MTWIWIAVGVAIAFWIDGVSTQVHEHKQGRNKAKSCESSKWIHLLNIT